MHCQEVMTENPKCCVPLDTIVRAAKLMRTIGVGALPVCVDRVARRLVGIVTDRDLVMRALAAGLDRDDTWVQDVMTLEPCCCHPGDDVEVALDFMARYQVRRIPVVGPREELLGIISLADIATRASHANRTAELLRTISRPSAMVA